MTRYLVLGHGGYKPDNNGSYPELILVPPDTKLFFMADAGSALLLPFKHHGPGKTKWGSDYAKVAPAWKQLQASYGGQGGEDELHFQGVTYNYKLYPDDTEEEREAAKAADWGGAQLIMIESGNRWLCEDTKGECPTPELLTMKSDDPRVEKPEVWQHKCSGILGEYGGKGHEIVWAACSSFEVMRPDLPPEITGNTAGPGASDPKDWTPVNANIDRIDKKNKEQGGRLKPKMPLGVLAGGGIVLLGEEHGPGPVGWVKRQGNHESGQITHKEKGAFNKEKIVVTGFSDKTNQANIETIVKGLKPDLPIEFA